MDELAIFSEKSPTNYISIIRIRNMYIFLKNIYKRSKNVIKESKGLMKDDGFLRGKQGDGLNQSTIWLGADYCQNLFLLWVVIYWVLIILLKIIN